MWQTYSVLSKTRKPRISSEEFLDFYHIDKSEIQDYELRDFLDFFEVSKDDLFMESKEEVFLMLQGFRLDREAESTMHQDLNTLAEEKILKVKFSCVNGCKTICGEIDFMSQILDCENGSHTFSDMDKLVLWQILKDMDTVRNMTADSEPIKDGGLEFEILDLKGERHLVKRGQGYAGIFLRIVGVIMERG